jgi:hypothetical protein
LSSGFFSLSGPCCTMGRNVKIPMTFRYNVCLLGDSD